MDANARAAKLALARKKLKDHQEKKSIGLDKDENLSTQGDINQTAVTNDHNVVPIIEKVNKNKEETVENGNLHQDLTNETSNNIDINVTEFLISNKRILELQINDLQSKLLHLENVHSLEINNHNNSKQQINNLQNELKHLHEKYLIATEQIQMKDKTIYELNGIKLSISDENNNLIEQLEFTKTILTAKETENASLHSQLSNLQNQLDATQLQLQQLTNGSPAYISNNSKNFEMEQNEVLLQKISSLEQQLKGLQQEKDQMNLHYEHYLNELSEQLTCTLNKNDDLRKEIQNLSNRENSLIDQISDMEIRLQSYRGNEEILTGYDNQKKIELSTLEKKYEDVQEKLKELSIKYDELQNLYLESESKVKELTQMKESGYEHHDNISISKLNADITSDKIAAQRATEQNKKLKTDVQELEEAFIKMSKDKLELTEKLTAEKYLNRQLTIKLAEIEDKAKDMHIKLMAKDEEMIRLQTSHRMLEKEILALSENLKQLNNENVILENKENYVALQPQPEDTDQMDNVTPNSDISCTCDHETLIKNANENKSLYIPKEDAMLKLQDRFLKIMEEVADLSDEKHRLEHIIMQLQNETDTICEYVALYQQQRSLLKKRDEERSAQIKIFQSECDRLKNQIEELSTILRKFADDKQLCAYFKTEAKHNDLEKVMNLLSNLKNNSLIDPIKNNLELKNFYPCNCCSGKLIDI